VGPGTHQTRTLVAERRKFHLQHAFTRSRACTEDFQDQTRAVDHLALPGALEVLLLHRRQCSVDRDDPDLAFGDDLLQPVNRAGTKESGRTDLGNVDDLRQADLEVDRGGKTDRFIQTRGSVAPLLGTL